MENTYQINLLLATLLNKTSMLASRSLVVAHDKSPERALAVK